MGQHVVNTRIMRHRGATTDWEVGHHIGHPAQGQPTAATMTLAATQLASLSTAVATSDAAVGTWCDDELPAAWAWGATEAAKLRASCQDCGI